MKRNRAGIVAAIAVLVVIGVAVMRSLAHGVPQPPVAPVAVPSVTLAAARTGTFEDRVELRGRIGAPAGGSAKVSFAQSGVLKVLEVAVGEPVSAGQPLAELDRAALSASLAAAQADVQAAGSVQSAIARAAVANDKLAVLKRGGQAALSGRIVAESEDRQARLKVETDRAALERQQTLFAAGVVAGKDVDAARTQLASDQADQQSANAKVAAASADFRAALKQASADAAGTGSDVQTARGQRAAAQARLTAARIAYENGVLSASADGVVLAVFKHPGEAVDPSIPVIEVGPARTTVATLTAPAATARRVHVGDPVSLRLTTGASTSGTVMALVPAVDPAEQVGTIVVSGVPPGAVPGDAVTAGLVVGHTSGVLVPSRAIVEDPQTGKTVVFVHSMHPKAGDSAFASRDVIVRGSDATSAVVAGLRPGERVAAQGSYLLLAPAGD
jgi:multidrug efflux pump subunit AcrA (membrane-fusion protein)